MAGGTFLELLAADDVDALAQAGRRQRHPARSRVFEEGDPGYEVLIVEQGSVKLVRVSTDGRELVVAVRGEGAILGELSAIDGGVRSTSASTLTPVQLIAVSFERFRELLDTRAGIAPRCSMCSPNVCVKAPIVPSSSAPPTPSPVSVAGSPSSPISTRARPTAWWWKCRSRNRRSRRSPACHARPS